MANYIIDTINEFEFDCMVAELVKEHDYDSEIIEAFGYLRKKIFGRLLADMPEELFLESTIEMVKIWKG